MPFQFGYVRPPDRRAIFDSTLLHADNRLVVLRHALSPSQPLVIDGVTVLDTGYHALWFLYKGEAWDLARVSTPDGQVTGYYVDALAPVHWVDADPVTLEPLTDLFLDMWITPVGTVEVLDEAELQLAEAHAWVTSDQAALARATISRLVTQTAAGLFPPREVRVWES